MILKEAISYRLYDIAYMLRSRWYQIGYTKKRMKSFNSAWCSIGQIIRRNNFFMNLPIPFFNVFPCSFSTFNNSTVLKSFNQIWICYIFTKFTFNLRQNQQKISWWFIHLWHALKSSWEYRLCDSYGLNNIVWAILYGESTITQFCFFSKRSSTFIACSTCSNVRKIKSRLKRPDPRFRIALNLQVS